MSMDQPFVDSFRLSEIKHSGLLAHDPEGPEQARTRIIARLHESANAPDVKEFRFSLASDWDMIVFQALLKRYDIKCYRYRKQRKSTVLVRLSEAFIDDVLMPIFTEAAREVAVRLAEVTRSLVPAIAPGPFRIAILDHDHSAGQLCENCLKHIRETD